MSAQDKNVGFDLNDTDFPELSSKMTGRKEKGRRSAAVARYSRQAERAGAFLVKTIDDPNHTLGKRRKERVASESNDGFASGVVYSMNKNNRWDEVSANALLENTSEIPVEVIERVITAKDTSSNVIAFHALDTNGELKTETSSGKGSNLNALLIGEGRKTRGRKARKEAELAALEAEENATAESSEGEESAEPRVQYTIYKPHKNHKVLAGKLFNRSYNIKKAGKARTHNNKINLDELETSDMENSIQLVSDSIYKPSRDFKFCLGDYINEPSTTSKQSNIVFVRRESIESVQAASEVMNDNVGPKPFGLLDISSILRAPVAFEWVLLDTSKWNNFNFQQEIEELTSNEKLDVQWLDADKTRVSIDASRIALPAEQPYAAPVLIIVMEKASSNKRNQIRVLLNSDVAPSGPFSWQILKSLLKGSSKLCEVVSVMAKLVSEWKEGSAPECIEGIKRAKSRFDARRDHFQPAYNAALFSIPTQVLTAEKMAKLVREEARNSKSSSESFERIDFDCEGIDFVTESEDEEASLKKSELIKVKCESCDNKHSTELFELDDCWQCRDCLRKFIIEQIRSRCVPLDIPFVINEGQSAYDILPAIIPLPLLHFYTKMTATIMLETSDVEIGELGECPSCKQLVQITYPNEYNTCNCVSCGIHWCCECKSEPHWPMSCAAFATWIEKWEKEYNLHVVEKTEHLKKIKCPCGYDLEIRDKAIRGECAGCGRVFNPQNWKLLEKTYWQLDNKTGELIRRSETTDTYQPISIETAIAVKTIKKEFTEVCGQARKLRFSSSKKAEFEKAVRKLKNTHAGVEKLREIRKIVLLLVENGLAFVYSEKSKDVEMKDMKQNLIQLMKQWLDIESEVHHPRYDFSTRIESIHSNVYKTLELIKSTINI